MLAAALALPATGASPEPRALVLQRADVPGWRLDLDNSGPRSNKSETESDPELRSLFRRAGRLNGYEAIYNRRAAEISSRADVFRQPEGARMLLRWFEKQLSAFRGALRRTPAGIGAEGWMLTFREPPIGSSTVVVWRRGRIFAGLWTTGVSAERTVSLARVQDRRIAAVLR